MNKLFVFPVVAATALACFPCTSEARSNYELGRMAHEIEKTSRELKSEFKTHYHRSSAYQYLLKGAEGLIKKAEHIDELTHVRNIDYKHMASDLESFETLTKLIHKLLDDVQRGKYRGEVDKEVGHVHRKLSYLADLTLRMETRVADLSKAAAAGYSENSSGRYFDVTSRKGKSGLSSMFSPFFGGLSVNRDTAKHDSHHGHSH